MNIDKIIESEQTIDWEKSFYRLAGKFLDFAIRCTDVCEGYIVDIVDRCMIIKNEE